MRPLLTCLFFSVAAFAADRCPLQANIALTSVTGNQQVIAIPAANGRPIYICHVSLSWAVATLSQFKIVEGTGANCASNAVDRTGTYKDVTSMVLPFDNSPLYIAPGRAVCLYFSGTVSPGGVIRYAN